MKSTLRFLTALSLCLSILSAHAERLVLVGASYGKNILAITDAEGEVLWSHKTAGPTRGHAGHHDVHLLPNGNILFHDTWTTLKEITLDQKVVWTYDSAKQNGNAGKRVHVHAFARLANGNTMIVESGVGRVIEVNTKGKLVHQFPLKPGPTQNTRWARHTPKAPCSFAPKYQAWSPSTIVPEKSFGITSSRRACMAPSASQTATRSLLPVEAKASSR